MLIETYAEKLRVTRNAANEPIIEARNGHVYDGFWADKLGYWVETTRPNTTLKALQARIPGLEALQLGEFESIFSIPCATFDQGLKNLRKIGAHKVREYDPEVLARLKDHGKALAEKFPLKNAP